MKIAVMPTLAALVLASAHMAGTVGPASADNNTGAVIGGLIAGAAIGAAVSSAIDHPKPTHSPKPPPPPPKPNPWSNVYHPTHGISCYPVQHACYNNKGAYNANWTWKVYAK